MTQNATWRTYKKPIFAFLEDDWWPDVAVIVVEL